jgi:hypothetical protein
MPPAEAAPPPPVTAAPTTPAPPPPPSAPMVSKFSATLYGFVELDVILDSTQSFNDLAGNAGIAHAGSYAADNKRLTMGARNSRLGYKLKGPESDMVKTSGMIEADFLGNQPLGSPAPAGTPPVSESSFFTSPTFRIRHMLFRMETPYVDLLVGQYWELFGWQSLFHPATVEIQGVPGQIYSRAPQVRLSHAIKTDAVALELAIAASRPPQRDSAVPDGQAGVKLSIPSWKGLHTGGAAGTAVDGAALGVSGVERYFRVPNLAATPTEAIPIHGWGISVDALIPVIPATDPKSVNALTLTGSFVYGQATADLYTGLTGGASFPSLPNDAMGKPQTYPQDIDNGLAVFTADGVLHAIRWESFIVGAQYYFPTSPRLWVAANYSYMKSSNIDSLLTATGSNGNKLWDKSWWADGNVFFDANSAVRFGFEYAYFHQNYLDGTTAKNNRFQLSGFYIF